MTLSDSYFKPDKDNKFWPVYEAIQTYYPLGVERIYPGPYYDYAGTKKIDELITTRIHVRSNYEEEWESLCKAISEKFKLPIIGTTMGQAPSFSAFVVLKEEQGITVSMRDELHFVVSLLGPFYTIYQQITTIVKGDKEDQRYVAVNVLCSSPSDATKIYFEGLKKYLCEAYGNLKFVPYALNKKFVEGLWVRYRDDAENRVYHALFNHMLDFNVPHRGTSTYGANDWG